MASIKDVARLAGVSIATVSRAVNNLDVVSDGTRRRIAWAVERLGYHPNLAARSLKRRSARLLGLLVPDIENPYYATLAKHMETAANAAGFSLILCNTDGVADTEEHYLKLLSSHLSDGIFLCRSAIRDASFAGAGGRRIPLVVLEKHNADDRRAAVMVDNFAVGRLAAAHIASLGHRRIACIVEDRAVFPFALRLEGFMRESARRGAALSERDVAEAGPRIADGRNAMRTLLRRSAGRRPTAVYCTNDLLAFGAMQALLERGVSIPGDVSIMGTDDVPQSSYMYPPLTTVAQPFAAIAREALGLLLAEGGGSSDILLKPALKVRKSTGPTPDGREKGP